MLSFCAGQSPCTSMLSFCAGLSLRISMPTMPLIAVTGGIGCGKTTVLGCFQKQGCLTLDADELAHEMYLPGTEAWRQMTDRWGKGILAADGSVDRKAVARIVFSEQRELAWLNQLLHPLLREEIQRRGRQNQGVFTFCAVPLLYELGWLDGFDAVVATWCPREVQRERLRQRGWSDDEIDARLRTQLAAEEKLERADYGIVTSCTWESLDEQCAELLALLKQRFAKKD